MAELVDFLANKGGYWIVSMPVGECAGLALDNPTIEEAFVLVDGVSPVEPPAAYRPSRVRPIAIWQGQARSWERTSSGGVVELVTISRSTQNALHDEGWAVWVAYEVGRPSQVDVS